MMYITRVKYWSDFDNKDTEVNCFVCADDFKDVIDKMEGYYGKDMLEEIEIKLFSPDDFLEFEADNEGDMNLFVEIYARLGDRVIW